MAYAHTQKMVEQAAGPDIYGGGKNEPRIDTEKR